MAKLTDQVTAPVVQHEPARCMAIAEKGIKTADDFKGYMSALMSDLTDGRITPMIGNAVCNAGGKLLKAVELQYKYGTDGSATAKGKKTLQLTD